MNYTQLQCLSRRKFKRRFGVEKKTFKRMKLAIEEQMPQFKTRGCPRKLGILVIEQKTGLIICTFFGRGQQHDFSLFKNSKVRFHPSTDSLQDSGYQGISQYHQRGFKACRSRLI